MSHTQALHDLGTTASQPFLSLPGSRQQGCRRSRASAIGQRRLLLATAFMLPVFVGLMACAQALLSPGPSLGAEAFWSAPSLPNGRAIVYGLTNSPSILGLSGLVDVVPSEAPAHPAHDFPHRVILPGDVPGPTPLAKEAILAKPPSARGLQNGSLQLHRRGARAECRRQMHRWRGQSRPEDANRGASARFHPAPSEVRNPQDAS
jgi:hypothetical protein